MPKSRQLPNQKCSKSQSGGPTAWAPSRRAHPGRTSRASPSQIDAKPSEGKPEGEKRHKRFDKNDRKPDRKFDKPKFEKPKRPEKPMDPNSPFAALAALKASMGKGN